MALQFLNIKAWMLALTLTAGWVVNAAASRDQPGERLAIICAVMVVFAFTSNFTYALAGSLLRAVAGAGQRACSGSTARWPRCWCSPPAWMVTV